MKKETKNKVKEEVKSKIPFKNPDTPKEMEAERVRRSNLSQAEREVEDTAGVKSYDEKVEDYKEHFDNLGMHDPGTEARIQAMEEANPRVDSDPTRAPELIARDEVRAAKAEELSAGTTGNPGEIPPERKASNERLSEVLTDRKENDEEQQELQEEGKVVNIARGGSQEAERMVESKEVKSDKKINSSKK